MIYIVSVTKVTLSHKYIVSRKRLIVSLPWAVSPLLTDFATYQSVNFALDTL